MIHYKKNLNKNEIIQRQEWKDEVRILIIDNYGSVQLSIPFYHNKLTGKADALIHTLYVDIKHRRQGIAKRLLHLAEQQAKLNHVKVVELEFDIRDTESFVLNFYLKNGYKPFNRTNKLLIKNLNKL